jgi:hypothetical protein
MEQSPNDAALNGVQTMLEREECAKDTGQRGNYVELKDAPIKLRVEECARDIGKGEKQFSSEGCPNQSQKGGMCVEGRCVLCSTGGCINQVQVEVFSKEGFASG